MVLTCLESLNNICLHNLRTYIYVQISLSFLRLVTELLFSQTRMLLTAMITCLSYIVYSIYYVYSIVEHKHKLNPRPNRMDVSMMYVV